MSDRKDDMNYQAADFLKADFLKADFVKDYQALAQKSWEAMVGQLQKPPRTDDFINSVFPADSTASVTLEHALSGLKSYAEWMQGAATSVGAPGTDWAQQLEQLFGKAHQPFASAFTGVDPGMAAGAQDFSGKWQAWLQSLQNNHASTAHGAGPFAPFAADQEQQAEQRRLMAAINAHIEAANRYQQLIRRSNENAIEKMRARLAPLAAPPAQIESLKMLYDVWVECAEEAHAEIALSDEFREAYAGMVNTQMRVRHLQQAQTEKVCQQMGIPTRSDVDSLGERLHAFRREMRGGSAAAPHSQADEISQLRREVAELRKLIAGSDDRASASKKRATAPAGRSTLSQTPAVKKATSRAAAKASKSTQAEKKTNPAKVVGKGRAAASTRKKK